MAGWVCMHLMGAGRFAREWRRPAERRLLTARLSGHRLMINGNAFSLLLSLVAARSADPKPRPTRRAQASEHERSEVITEGNRTSRVAAEPSATRMRRSWAASSRPGRSVRIVREATSLSDRTSFACWSRGGFPRGGGNRRPRHLRLSTDIGTPTEVDTCDGALRSWPRLLQRHSSVRQRPLPVVDWWHRTVR